MKAHVKKKLDKINDQKIFDKINTILKQDLGLKNVALTGLILAKDDIKKCVEYETRAIEVTVNGKKHIEFQKVCVKWKD